jgi:probable F420-dependent oxidoreductase
MQFGIYLGYGVGSGAAYPDYARAAARLVEAAGFESLWTGEHVLFPRDYDSIYPYGNDGKWPGPPATAVPDPLVWFAFIAAATTRLRLATGVVLLPQHHPLLLAKQVATLDLLSGGRFLLGVGVGWLREECEALGVDFSERAARTDEHIAVMRTVWRDEVASFRGRFTAFERITSRPAPVQPGGVPIIIGGHSKAAARRAGRLGDGFCPAAAPGELGGLLAAMREAAEAAGRDPAAIEITCPLPWGDVPLALVEDYAAAGVRRLIVIRGQDTELDSLKHAIDRFHDTVLARLPVPKTRPSRGDETPR